MYFITTKRMLELCFSAHPNIQYRTRNVSAAAFLVRLVDWDQVSVLNFSRRWDRFVRQWSSCANSSSV